MKYLLFFGDSITQGFWDEAGGWVQRIRQQYDLEQVQDIEGSDAPAVFNLGVSGDTSNDLVARIEQEIKSRSFESRLPVITVQIGINDSILQNGQLKVPVENYKQNINKIIEIAKQNTEKLMFVGLTACDESRTSPVFWNEDYFANDRIFEYEQTMKKIAEEQEIEFIPVFELFKSELDSGRNLLLDGLHPNSLGHKLITDIVKPHIDKVPR